MQPREEAAVRAGSVARCLVRTLSVEQRHLNAKVGTPFWFGDSVKYSASEPGLIEGVYGRVSAVGVGPLRTDEWRGRFARPARPSWIGRRREILAAGLFPVCQFRRCQPSGGISSASRGGYLQSSSKCQVLLLYECCHVESQEGSLKLVAAWVGFLLVWLPSRGADWQMQASRVPSWHELRSVVERQGWSRLVTWKMGMVAVCLLLRMPRC